MVNRTTKKLNIGIIGGGITSYIAAYELSQLFKRRNNSDFSLTIIDGSSYIPSASWNSTATVALRNTQKNMSDLGDLIFDGYHHLLKFIQENRPAGVEVVNFYTLDQNDDEKWKLRYGAFVEEGSIDEIGSFFAGNMYTEKGIIFYPYLYRDWLIKNSEVKIIQDFIVSFDDHWTLTGANAVYDFDFIFDCRGAWSADVSPVQGGYFETHTALAKKSFFLECDGLNLIYRHLSQEVQFGATTIQGDIFPMGSVELLKKLEKFAHFFPHLNLTDFEWKFFSSLRAKGRKRLPVFKIDKLQKKILLTGLYKNGFCMTHQLFLSRENEIWQALT